jgi:hypothetical protein
VRVPDHAARASFFFPARRLLLLPRTWASFPPELLHDTPSSSTATSSPAHRLSAICGRGGATVASPPQILNPNLDHAAAVHSKPSPDEAAAPPPPLHTARTTSTLHHRSSFPVGTCLQFESFFPSRAPNLIRISPPPPVRRGGRRSQQQNELGRAHAKHAAQCIAI